MGFGGAKALVAAIFYGRVILIKFSYDLDSIGWVNVHLIINGKEGYFTPSYVSEALVDLLDAVMCLMPEFTPVDELKETASFEWDQEPAIAVWNLRILDEGQLAISIKQYKDGIKALDEKDLGEPLLNGQCDLNEFVYEIVNSVDQMIIKYGLVGYGDNWCRGDFPIGRYLKLKSYVLSGQTLRCELINECTWNEYRRTNLETEMNLLRGILRI